MCSYHRKFCCVDTCDSTVISETLIKVSVSTTLAQSWLVSVSTSLKILGLDKSRSRQLLLSLGWSRSRHPPNFLVLKSLRLDISQNFMSQKVSVSTSFVFWVSQIHCQYIIWNISTILLISDQIMHKSGTNDQFPLNAFVLPINVHRLFAFSLGLGLSLDLETNIPGLVLGLVTETRRFKVSVESYCQPMNGSKLKI